MALIKCPECGKEVSDSAKTCPNCGYPIAKTVAAQEKTTVSKKSKWSKIILWFVIVYGILTAIFLWALYQSDWSASAVKSIISNGNFSCLFSHTFEEPNCVHGKLCTKCGYETGDLTPHTWVDATCTKPKTCSVCGKQSGKKLEHDFKTEIVKASTYMEEGIEKKVCVNCGYSETAAIPILVFPFDIKLPKTPITVNSYLGSMNFGTVRLDKIKWSCNIYSNNRYSVYLNLTGEVISRIDNGFMLIDYNLLDSDGFSISSGTFYLDDLPAGSKFKNKEVSVTGAIEIPAGKYTLELG